MPAVPAQRRCVARRAVQHRLLRVAHAHGCRSSASSSRRVHLDGRGLPPVFESPGAGRPAVVARRRTRCPGSSIRRRPPSLFDYEFDGFRDPELPAPLRDQSADRRLTSSPSLKGGGESGGIHIADRDVVELSDDASRGVVVKVTASMGDASGRE